jgi:hypothetical protein
MKVNKQEILSQFFQNISGREGLDPEYQWRVQNQRPSMSYVCNTKKYWPDLEDEETSKSCHNLFVKSHLSKKEKKQIRKNLIESKKGIVLDVIPAEKKKV